MSKLIAFAMVTVYSKSTFKLLLDRFMRVKRSGWRCGTRVSIESMEDGAL
jgi:hypothetical protein